MQCTIPPHLHGCNGVDGYAILNGRLVVEAVELIADGSIDNNRIRADRKRGDDDARRGIDHGEGIVLGDVEHAVEIIVGGWTDDDGRYSGGKDGDDCPNGGLDDQVLAVGLLLVVGPVVITIVVQIVERNEDMVGRKVVNTLTADGTHGSAVGKAAPVLRVFVVVVPIAAYRRLDATRRLRVLVGANGRRGMRRLNACRGARGRGAGGWTGRAADAALAAVGQCRHRR